MNRATARGRTITGRRSIARRSAPPSLKALALGALLTASLIGCGSATKTVSVSGSPPAPSSQDTHETTSTAASTATSSSTSTATSAATATTTRTSSAPAFTHGETGAQSGGDAAAIVRAHGYTPNEVAQYRPSQTLRVLLATRTGSGEGHDQQAFFFVDGRYIGTDASQPSAGVRLVSQSDTEVTLAYSLYRARDALCCPSGGAANVRFQLNNGKLTPVDPIPPANSATGLSRH